MVANPSTLHFGELAEMRVKAKLIDEGFDIYSPHVDDRGIDCVIRKEDGHKHAVYIDIQIKGLRLATQENGAFKGTQRQALRKKLQDHRLANYFFIIYYEYPDGSDDYWVLPAKDLKREIDKPRPLGFARLLMRGGKEEVVRNPDFDHYLALGRRKIRKGKGFDQLRQLK